MRDQLFSLVGTIGVLSLWLIWFLNSLVAIYAPTLIAQLAVDRENHPIDAPIGGRVVVASGHIGQVVQAGDVLLILDADLERFAHQEVQARLTPAATQIASLQH